MRVLVILAALIAYSYALSFEDCGGANAMVKVHNVQVDGAIQIPGTIRGRADVQLVKSFKGNLNVELDIKKKVFGIYVKVPCISNAGSCTYADGCTIFAQTYAKAKAYLSQECPAQLVSVLGLTCAEYKPIQQQILAGQCPTQITDKFGITCHEKCPVPPMRITVPWMNFNAPELPAGVGALAKGDYKMTAKLLNADTGAVEGCVKVSATIK